MVKIDGIEYEDPVKLTVYFSDDQKPASEVFESTEIAEQTSWWLEAPHTDGGSPIARLSITRIYTGRIYDRHGRQVNRYAWRE